MWTDERLDDLATQMATGFAAVDRELRGVREEIGALRTEVKGDIRDLKGDIAELRTMMFRFALAMMVCLIGVIVTGAAG